MTRASSGPTPVVSRSVVLCFIEQVAHRRSVPGQLRVEKFAATTFGTTYDPNTIELFDIPIQHPADLSVSRSNPAVTASTRRGSTRISGTPERIARLTTARPQRPGAYSLCSETPAR
ncbi:MULTISPECIES: hypothetical protein [unclassified Nocardia]|uniref:hypothetical protein n=1 Tax=unclassified Nocardia TaxID=2637762 RepID=UPI0033B19101